jgi:hypothetical protein
MRPASIVLISAGNIIQQQKDVAKQSFKFYTTRNWTRIITTGIEDYLAVKAHFDTNNLAYFAFYPKSVRPIKSVLPHLPLNTPVEDIPNGLDDFGFDVISINQMSSTHRSSAEGPTKLPLLLMTVPRMAKSKDIFKLPSLCHISIKVEAYKSHMGKLQTATYYLWRDGGHLHRDCPEKGNASSKPACCNCQLDKGESAHPTNYLGWNLAKKVLQKKKSQATPRITGRVFSSNFTMAMLCLAEVLQGKTGKSRTSTHQEAAEGLRDSQPTRSEYQHETGQSVPATDISSLPLDNMFRVEVISSHWGCVRGGKNFGHYRSCFQLNERKWQIEFIGPSKS